MKRKLGSGIVGTGIVLLGVVACSSSSTPGGGGTGGGGDGGTTVATGIGPAGGTVTHPSGAKVVIPPDALKATVNIEIAEEATPASLPFSASGKFYWLKPEGQKFERPVMITLPYDPAIEPGPDPQITMFTAPHGTTTFTARASTTVDPVAHTVSAPATSFCTDGPGCHQDRETCADPKDCCSRGTNNKWTCGADKKCCRVENAECNDQSLCCAGFTCAPTPPRKCVRVQQNCRTQGQSCGPQLPCCAPLVCPQGVDAQCG
jgi:hypothetical protein